MTAESEFQFNCFFISLQKENKNEEKKSHVAICRKQ